MKKVHITIHENRFFFSFPLLVRPAEGAKVEEPQRSIGRGGEAQAEIHIGIGLHPKRRQDEKNPSYTAHLYQVLADIDDGLPQRHRGVQRHLRQTFRVLRAEPGVAQREGERQGQRQGSPGRQTWHACHVLRGGVEGLRELRARLQRY